MDARYERLERMREDIRKDRDKISRIQDQIKVKEAKLKQAESGVILADVGSYNMTPEELAGFLKLIKSGQLGLKNIVDAVGTPVPEPEVLNDDYENEEEEDNSED